MDKLIRIGTRESQLARWQAELVQGLVQDAGFRAELVLIKTEGDIDLHTPLYEMNVQGIFTRSLDIALLNERIDIAVHSMKDVPTRLATGIVPAAVLARASHKDIFVYKDAAAIAGWQLDNAGVQESLQTEGVIATSSIRRKAQWLHRYPKHRFENLRGNVNTRLRKLQEQDWQGAIFAAAGLERIGLRPKNAIDLEWMLPAPAQGAILVVCRETDEWVRQACRSLNDPATELCTRIERDFLRTLQGGCSTPISALARLSGELLTFKGNILSVDGKEKLEVEKQVSIADADRLGHDAARELLNNGAAELAFRTANE